ncbi:MAG: cytochrome c [Crocinitomicaceae bacterium]|nr:cytochrome c [Crocinitomicaceae bacterium]
MNIDQHLYDVYHFWWPHSPLFLAGDIFMYKGKGNFIVLIALVSVFTVYNAVLYMGEETSSSSAPRMSKEAIRGEQLWQENNCTACHQLYGLGGYLGPDLTNVISDPAKGSDYVRTFLNSGVKSMPQFDFSTEEQNAIISYLEHVNATGYYPNYDSEFSKDGWVTIKYK